MRERMLVGVGIGLCVTMVALTITTWSLVRSHQQLAALQLETTSRQLAVLEKLSQPSPQPLSTFCTAVIETDRPTNSVALLSSTRNCEGVPTANGNGGETIEFGDIHPGVYTLYLTAGKWSFSRRLLLRAGDAHRQQIAIPAEPKVGTLRVTSNLSPAYGEPIPLHIEPIVDEPSGWSFQRGDVAYTTNGDVISVPQVPLGKLKVTVAFSHGTNGYHDGFGSASINGFKSTPKPPANATHTGVWSAAPSCEYHTVEFDFKPDSPPCHLEFPSEWLAFFEERAHPIKPASLPTYAPASTGN